MKVRAMDHEVEIAIYEAQRAHELELDRASATFEHAVLSPLFLLNGGAAAAFLALLGTNTGSQILDPGLAVAAAMTWALGLVAGALAARYGSLAQTEFTRAVRQRRLLYERALTPETSALYGRLREPSEETPEEIHSKGQRIRKKFEYFAGSSVVLFIVGLVFAAIAVAVHAG